MTPTGQPPLGTKFDQQKDRWDLLPLGVMAEVVKVLTHGTKKYQPNNWKHVRPYRSRYFAAAMRHLAAWQQGEQRDPETNLNHLAHACCCIVFLLWAEQQNLQENPDAPADE